MQDYIIQKLQPEDYKKSENSIDPNRDAPRSRRWYNDLLSGNRVMFSYTENGEFIGEAALVFRSEDPDYTIPGKRIYLSAMIIKDGHRNRGIGGLLIDHLLSCAKDMGYEEMSVGVDIINIGARWLYEKKGFLNIVFVGEDSDGKYVKLLKAL